jgi:Acetyltransferase (GNAT) domain
MTLRILRSGDLGQLLRPICDFLDRQTTSHPFQFPQWASPESCFAVIEQNATIRWYANCGVQHPLGKCLPWISAFIINRGPVCDDPVLWREGLLALIQHLEREKYIYLDASPDRIASPRDDGAGFLEGRKWEQIANPRYSLRLDLTKDEELLFSNLRKVTRYEVRRAERAGLQVTLPNSDIEINAFLNVYARMAERKMFLPDTCHHMWEVIRWLKGDPQRGALLIAKYGEAVQGGAIIVRAGTRCWYVWGASQKHPLFSCGHLVQWKALLWAKSHGCTEYDFGGYAPSATSGPAWFKEGFRGSVVRFVPRHRAVLRASRYRALKLLSRA